MISEVKPERWWGSKFDPSRAVLIDLEHHEKYVEREKRIAELKKIPKQVPEKFTAKCGNTCNPQLQYGVELSIPATFMNTELPPFWQLWKKYKTRNSAFDGLMDIKSAWGAAARFRIVKLTYNPEEFLGYTTKSIFEL